MRLKVVQTGRQPLWKRVLRRALLKHVKHAKLGVSMAGRYRPELFGNHFNTSKQRALEGPSEWTFGERQLFAAFVSKLNGCSF